MPAPWLHLLTRADSFNGAAAANLIAGHFEIPPERLESFMKAVSVCNKWLMQPSSISDKRGVVQWGWNIELYAPLSNPVRTIIGFVFLPLILTDLLLHVSAPDPAPTVLRAQNRVAVTSPHFRSRSDWTSLLCCSHTCYSKHIKDLHSSSTTRVAAKKADLLGFWRELKLVNPLLTVVRNLSHVALVISLYLLGDVTFSSDGREEYLMMTARSLGVSLSLIEAKDAVANTDISLMMAPVLVAVGHSPLLLLGSTGYASTQFTSRVPLLESWRALGNVHHVDLTDPLGRVDAILWRLLFRLALREITELQLLHFFYTDDFVRQTLDLLDQNQPLPALGHGLSYAGDLRVSAPDMIDLTEDNVDEDVAIQLAPLVEKKEKPAQQPPRKKQKTESAAAVQDSDGAGPSRNLRSRPAPSSKPGSSGRSVEVAPLARSTTRAPATRSKSSSNKKRPLKKKSSAQVGDNEDESSEDVPSPLSYADLRSLAVIDGWKLPVLREVESMRQTADDPDRVLDPTLVYDLASDDFTVDIEYWVFAPAPDDPSDPLVATPHKYCYRPFHETRSEAEFLKKIVNSQPFKTCRDTKRDLPLHIHPDARRFRQTGPAVSDAGEPLLPDVLPSGTESIVYVVHEDTWKSLTPQQHQEVLRVRAVLVIHRNPYLHDGRIIKFDEDGLEAFTHLDRLAFIQDLGARCDGKDMKLSIGRPRDLLVCSKARKASEQQESEIASTSKEGVLDNNDRDVEVEADEPPKPRQSQRLNLLGNTLQSSSLPLPSGWIDLASHEYACTWLEHLERVPSFVFPWSETTWNITANAHAVSWIHNDVLFTVVEMPSGEKLWYLARRRTDLPLDNFRGIMRSRCAFDDFNGWTDMTSVWDFEQVHLSPYTTLYMPATFPHAVISLTDCIGAGRHGVPISNLSHCVYVTLHNTVCAKSTTNADHEPARRFLVRGRSEADGISPLPSARTRVHLPDLSTNHGVIDLLALRSFVILVLALNGSSYAYSVSRDPVDNDILPLETEEARELSLAWKLAHNLVDYVSGAFTFTKTPVRASSSSPLDVRTPASFAEAADLSLVTMAVSMHKYISSTHKKSLPRGFNADSFGQQAKRMLILFELHKDLSPVQRETQLFADLDTDYRGSEVSSSTEFIRFVADRTRSFIMLQPWDSSTLPFSLIPAHSQNPAP
ncbi:hypothetical protein MSAN_00580900 [Mycena sanguinolenta]|uniref:JmjC domain-containing protein n=1 Tax=Mycena sanguinolenta TaxID=230812 RepID=A0A8H6ZAJ2_9AGAR|nr:hypothetical protein MSAN_00580900 [Mycena sanguinolenta]